MKNFFSGFFLLLLLTIIQTNLLALNKIDPFDEIILLGNVSALLVEGTTESIDIKNDEDQLEYEVVGKSLKVKAKDLVKYNKTPTVKVVITYKTIRIIRARAGASVYSQNPITGDKIVLRFSSGASGEIEISQNSLEVNVSEGGNLQLKGKTQWQEVRVATGGIVSAYDLECDNAFVKANTGGSAQVTARKSIDANANTGGSIIYKGNPKKIKEKDGISGTVKKG